MENKIFRFEKPTQIKFIDFDSGYDKPRWIGGIAFGSNIICGCCGKVYEIVDIWLNWEANKDDPLYRNISSPIEVFDCWVDLDWEIKGGD